MTMKTQIIVGIMLLCALGVSTGIYMYQKPSEKIVTGEASYVVRAADLFNDFDNNEAVANEKYLNKVITVQGKVAEISAGDSLGVNIILASSNPLFGVSCQLPAGRSNNGINAGDEISVTGLCTGKLMDVVLVKCRVEK